MPFMNIHFARGCEFYECTLRYRQFMSDLKKKLNNYTTGFYCISKEKQEALGNRTQDAVVVPTLNIHFAPSKS